MLNFDIHSSNKYENLFKPTTAKVLRLLTFAWNSNKKKPFYMFIEPSVSDRYKEGDSISEYTKIHPNNVSRSINELKNLGIIDYSYKVYNHCKIRYFTINEEILKSFKKKEDIPIIENSSIEARLTKLEEFYQKEIKDLKDTIDTLIEDNKSLKSQIATLLKSNNSTSNNTSSNEEYVEPTIDNNEDIILAPTKEEFFTYCEEIDCYIIGWERFNQHYSAYDWKYKGKPIDWKHQLNVWFQKELKLEKWNKDHWLPNYEKHFNPHLLSPDRLYQYATGKLSLEEAYKIDRNHQYERKLAVNSVYTGKDLKKEMLNKLKEYEGSNAQYL